MTLVAGDRATADPEAAAARITRWEAEMVDQALLFPQVWSAYLAHRDAARDAAALRALQRDRLTAVLGHAARQVPAYRDAAAGDRWTDPWHALAALPLVTKNDIRRRLSEFCDDDIDPAQCRMAETSGTSGEPFQFIQDAAHRAEEYALALCRNDRYGLPLHKRLLHPFHTWLDRWFEVTAPAQGLARIAMFGRDGDDAYWSDIRRRVVEYRPQVVIGHPSAAAALYDLLGPDNAGAVRPLALITWGERLPSGLREALVDYFAAPVYDTYGLREVGTVAAQCLAGSYHVESERLWVEVVSEDGTPLPDGETGEIVVTNLVNRAMPLIRYRTGDIGALSQDRCGCGAPYKVLSLVAGRDAGVVMLADGRRYGALRALWVVQGFPVERYQVVQPRPGVLEVIVAPLPAFSAEDAEVLAARTREAMDGGVEVRVVVDGGFVRAGRRKATDFVSLVEPDAAGGDDRS